MIDGVQIHPLRQIPDERGKVMHMLRATDPHFEQFGEIYFSLVNPGAVKGWHQHTMMTLNYAVVIGMIKLVLFDDRDGSRTHGEIQEIFAGQDNYVLIRIPPMVWNGFKGISTFPSVVANCATLPYDPGEIRRKHPFTSDIPYDWSLTHA